MPSAASSSPWCRKEERFDVDLPVTVHHQGSRYEGRTLDLSLSGARLAIDSRVPVGDAVVELPVAGRIAGRVVRRADGESVGIVFTDRAAAKAAMSRMLFTGKHGPVCLHDVSGTEVAGAVIRRLIA